MEKRYGIEIGVSHNKGSDYSVEEYDNEAEARVAYKTTAPPQQRGGYVSLVELDSTGCPQRTIATREYK